VTCQFLVYLPAEGTWRSRAHGLTSDRAVRTSWLVAGCESLQLSTTTSLSRHNDYGQITATSLTLCSQSADRLELSKLIWQQSHSYSSLARHFVTPWARFFAPPPYNGFHSHCLTLSPNNVLVESDYVWCDCGSGQSANLIHSNSLIIIIDNSANTVLHKRQLNW